MFALQVEKLLHHGREDVLLHFLLFLFLFLLFLSLLVFFLSILLGFLLKLGDGLCQRAHKVLTGLIGFLFIILLNKLALFLSLGHLHHTVALLFQAFLLKMILVLMLMHDGLGSRF